MNELLPHFKYNHISLLYDILFSFKSQISFFSRLAPSASFDKFIVCNNFSFDKFLFKVSMDHPCCLWRTRSFFDSPCTSFFFTCGEVVHESKCIECKRDHIIKRWNIFSRMHISYKLLSFFRRKSEHF